MIGNKNVPNILWERERKKNPKKHKTRDSLSILVRITFRNWLEEIYSFSSLLPTRRISLLSFSLFLILSSSTRFRWRLCYSTPLFTIPQASISPTLLDPSRILPVNPDLDHLDLSPSDTPQLLRSGDSLYARHMFGFLYSRIYVFLHPLSWSVGHKLFFFFLHESECLFLLLSSALVRFCVVSGCSVHGWSWSELYGLAKLCTCNMLADSSCVTTWFSIMQDLNLITNIFSI